MKNAPSSALRALTAACLLAAASLGAHAQTGPALVAAAAAPSAPAPSVSGNRRVMLPPSTGMRAVGRRPDATQQSVAHIWNEQLLAAIRRDTPRPTVHARNLFHLSAAMYDAWAVYDPRASGVLHHEKMPRAGNVEAARREAISHAAYWLLSHRFADSPNAATALQAFDDTMRALGYRPENHNTQGQSAAAVGNRVAMSVISHGLADGANENANYVDTTGYRPFNLSMTVSLSGAGNFADINRWQPLLTPGATAQQRFLTPHWRNVAPFALVRPAPGQGYLDPGPPPMLGGSGDLEVKAAVLALVRDSATLDPSDGVEIDISPSKQGNAPVGKDGGAGHRLNPATGKPYPANLVLRGDWGRVLSEFWADGPLSSTPPGHWNEIANTVSDHPLLQRRIGGSGPVVDRLQWDVKLYLALNGAVHDSAIAAWQSKAVYDNSRPITLIRGMAGFGQSSDPSLPSYHALGLPLEPGLVELVTTASAAPGQRHAHLAAHVGSVSIYAWRGHPADSKGAGGVGWILGVNWLPYQQRGFVTPPFPGYLSGHSTFSRASAEVLAGFTGNRYFPGGLGEHRVAAGDGFALGFEYGPSRPVRLQWATYADAADEAGLSRRYGGIHPVYDDLPARVLGQTVGRTALARAKAHFGGR
ncbi:MAG: vanadium-dependent haloperoxidase [Lysobacter sp.]|nr:vanadium-dependent haloperoxidase [Lysobacter sp.]